MPNEEGQSFEIKKGLDFLWEYLKNDGKDLETVLKKIKAVLTQGMKMICPFAQSSYLSAYGEQNAKLFQVVGFDVLLDNNMRPWILELNYMPSLKIDDPDPMSKSIPQADVNEIDFNVKSRVVGDAIRLMTRKNSSLHEAHSDYKSYEFLYNENLDNEKTVFSKAFELFKELQGVKKIGYLTTKQFAKVKEVLKVNELTTVDLELIYSKVMAGGVSKKMNFAEFLEGLEKVAAKKEGTLLKLLS